MRDLKRVVCGALSAYVVGGDDHAKLVVAAWISDGEPWYCQPFGDKPVAWLAAVDETRVLAMHGPSKDEDCFAVLNVAERTVSAVVKHHMYPSERLAVSAEHDRIVLLHGDLRCWRLSDLAELWRTKPPPLVSVAAAIRPDGFVVVKGKDVIEKHFLDKPRAITALFDPDGALVDSYGFAEPERRHGSGAYSSNVKRYQRDLSSRGRFLVGAHTGSVLMTDPEGVAIESLSDWESMSGEQLVETTKRIQVHGVYEIWDAAPLALRARVPVRSKSLFETLEKAPEAEGVDADAARSALRARMASPLRFGMSSEAAKAEMKRLDDLHHNFVMAKWAVKHLALFIEAKSYAAWRPDEPGALDLLPDSAVGMQSTYLSRTFAAVTGELTGWDGDDEAFVVEFPDRTRRRVTVDGAVTELPPLDPASRYSYAPEKIVKGARAFLRAQVMPEGGPIARWGEGPSTEDYGWLREAARDDRRGPSFRWMQELLLPDILIRDMDFDDSANALAEAIVEFSNWARGQAVLIPGEFPQEAYWVSALSTYLGQINNGGHGQFIGNYGHEWSTMAEACDRCLTAIGATDYAAIFSEFRALIDGDHDRATAIASSYGFGEQDAAIDDLNKRFFALKGTGDVIWRAADWIRQSPRIRPLHHETLATRKKEIEQSNTLRQQRIDAADKHKRERMQEHPAWRIAERLCGVIGVRLLALDDPGGPFAVRLYGIKSRQTHAFRLGFETSKGALDVIFLRRHGLLGQPTAILTAMMSGPLSTTTISVADYERIVPEDVREHVE